MYLRDHMQNWYIWTYTNFSQVAHSLQGEKVHLWNFFWTILKKFLNKSEILFFQNWYTLQYTILAFNNHENKMVYLQIYHLQETYLL